MTWLVNFQKNKASVFLRISIKIILLFILILKTSQADSILKIIHSRLLQSPISCGVFEQTKQLLFLHKPLLSKGTFTYDQKHGVIWKTLTPVTSTLVLNDTQLLAGQSEQALPPAFGRVFKALLGGEISQLNEDFEMTGAEQKAVWQLRLTPKDDFLKKVISAIILTGDTELRLLELHEVSGNLTKIRFSEIRHPGQLSNEQQAEFERLSP